MTVREKVMIVCIVGGTIWGVGLGIYRVMRKQIQPRSRQIVVVTICTALGIGLGIAAAFIALIPPPYDPPPYPIQSTPQRGK